MGNNLCSSQEISSLQQNTAKFLQAIKYYDTQQDPISGTDTQVYSYKQIFIHKKQFYLQTKQQLHNLASFILICARCPTGIQQIVQMSSSKNIKCSSNYNLCVFAQHLNFSLKKHIENLRFKGISLKDKQIFYILRELVYAGSYLAKKNFTIKSFDSDDIYMNAAYQIKIPIENIVAYQQSQFQYLPAILSNNNKQVLCLSPEQFDLGYKTNQTHTKPHNSLQLSRIFSLGMLILQCCTMLDSSITYYNYSLKKIDILKLHNDLTLLKDNKLANILSRMLQIENKKRIKFKQLEDILQCMDQNLFQKYLTIY